MTSEMPHRSNDPSTDLAFGRFYAEHHPEVLAYCRRRVGPQAAEDAAAEVFTAAWRKWETVPKGRDALPWLYGAARREVLHQWRSAARSRRLLERVRLLTRLAPDGPDRIVVREAEHEMALQALGRLRHRDQEVLRLALWEQLSYAEAAVVLGCSDVAARKRFSRAARRVGDEFRSLERQPSITPSRLRKGGDR